MSRTAGKNPAFQFYPKDWTADTRKLSPASRGIWIDLICDMWAQEPKGTTTGTIGELARAAHCTDNEIDAAIDQFQRLNICDVSRDCNGIVTLTCRRMVRDEQGRRKTARRVSEHRQRNVAVTELSRDSNAHSPTPTPTPCTTYTPPKPSDGGLERAAWLLDRIRIKAPSATVETVALALRGCEGATAKQMEAIAVRLESVTGNFGDPVAKIQRVAGDIVHPPEVGVRFEKRNAPPVEERRMAVSLPGELT